MCCYSVTKFVFVLCPQAPAPTQRPPQQQRPTVAAPGVSSSEAANQWMASAQAEAGQSATHSAMAVGGYVMCVKCPITAWNLTVCVCGCALKYTDMYIDS